MIRVSTSLETINLDFAAADPFYSPDKNGKLTAWYVPTPGLMAWFKKTLERAEAAKAKFTTNQLREFERMKSQFTYLVEWEGFTISDTPSGPYAMSPEDFQLTMDFVSAKRNPHVASARDFAAQPTSYRHPPRYIVAWRPVNDADAEASRLRGLSERAGYTGEPALESPALKIYKPEGEADAA